MDIIRKNQPAIDSLMAEATDVLEKGGCLIFPFYAIEDVLKSVLSDDYEEVEEDVEEIKPFIEQMPMGTVLLYDMNGLTLVLRDKTAPAELISGLFPVTACACPEPDKHFWFQ